jgi:phosphoglycerate dehydrogenase-like enzyme
MKPTAYLVNTSRGGVIKQEDLVQALNEEVIAGAALDVFEEEPLPMSDPIRQVDPERLIMTPHIIGTNAQSQVSGERMAAQSILAVLDGQVPETVVNPACVDVWRERFGAR